MLPQAMQLVALGAGDKAGEVRDAAAKFASALLKVRGAVGAMQCFASVSALGCSDQACQIFGEGEGSGLAS